MNDFLILIAPVLIMFVSIALVFVISKNDDSTLD